MYNLKNKIILIIFIIASFFVLTGCFGSNSNNITSVSENKIIKGDTVWKYEKTIIKPITTKVSTGTDNTLGNIEKDKASIVIPKNTFDGETQVELKTPDSVPEYFGKEVKMLGSPIEITASDKNRLNEPVTITFKYNDSDINMVRGTGSLRVTYYDGSKWEYIKPLSVDTEKKLITFNTFHFSLFGANQIEDDTVITENWVHSKTLDKQMKDGINSVSDHVAEQIIDLTLEKMGISDKTIKGKVLADVLKDDGYKGIYDSYKEGDRVDLSQKIALLAGKKIAQIVDESALQEGLSNIAGDAAEDIVAVSKAAGYIAGGQYKDAAKIIGEQIADKFIITAAGKIAVEVVDYQIESWKNNEVEAAYVAFRDGSNAKFYGYNNEKDDFDTVWSQMRGIGRQLCIEAIKKENSVRLESGLPKLTPAQEDRVRDGVKESYRRQFTERSKKEEELKKEEEKLRLLVGVFKDNNLFDTTTGPKGLDKGLDYENKLEVLYHFAEKMMKDTKRPELSELKGMVMDKKISIDDIAYGARLWFTVPDGSKLYADYLKTRFKIILAPDLSSLTGEWLNGSMTIKDVILSQEMISQIEAAKNKPKKDGLEGGCDFTFDLRMLKGKVMPATTIITPKGADYGLINIKFKDGKLDPMNFTYSNGIISSSMSKDGASGKLSLQALDDDKAYLLNGTFNITFGGGKAKIIVDLKFNRSKIKQVKENKEVKNGNK